MTDSVPYDAFADIYDAWAESAPITRKNQEFYVKCLVEADGPAVELGVGNGRICIEAAKRGKAVIGVDSSEKILELCETRARAAGVLDPQGVVTSRRYRRILLSWIITARTCSGRH